VSVVAQVQLRPDEDEIGVVRASLLRSKIACQRPSTFCAAAILLSESPATAL
jgi:hypothetical protein